MGKIPPQDRSGIFAGSDGYLTGGSNKRNNRNREKSGKGRGVDQQMRSELPPQRLAKGPRH